ncbi:MAG: hypothetical protein AMXMBFR56_26470 [Polyangiaceae bacterium]
MQLMHAIAENRLLSRWAAALPRSPGQVGSVHQTDAELVPLGDGRLLALTVDTVLEEIELGLYRDPRTAGRVAAAAALSDLAAVGAEPLGLLLSVSLPSRDTEAVQQAVAEGVAQTCRAAGTFVLGGDTNEGRTLSVTCVAAGIVPMQGHLSRVGMAPGDTVFASGPLGSGTTFAAFALLGLAERERVESDWQPQQRIGEGKALRGIASACMDTSDGLVATVDQLVRLNQVALRIDVPLDSLLDARSAALQRALQLSALPFLAAPHGEFELVFSVPESRLGALESAAKAMSWRPLRLGRVEVGAGLFVGSAPLDGARLRNLAGAAPGDLGAYISALSAL